MKQTPIKKVATDILNLLELLQTLGGKLTIAIGKRNKSEAIECIEKLLSISELIDQISGPFKHSISHLLTDLIDHIHQMVKDMTQIPIAWDPCQENYAFYVFTDIGEIRAAILRQCPQNK